jgi:hypothetical protein
MIKNFPNPAFEATCAMPRAGASTSSVKRLLPRTLNDRSQSDTDDDCLTSDCAANPAEHLRSGRRPVTVDGPELLHQRKAIVRNPVTIGWVR